MSLTSLLRAGRGPVWDWFEGGAVPVLDKCSLGLSVCLPVVFVALGERVLQRRVLRREDGVCTQDVAEVQATVEILGLVHEVQVVGAARGRGVAQEAPVGERRVERLWELVVRVCDQRGESVRRDRGRARSCRSRAWRRDRGRRSSRSGGSPRLRAAARVAHARPRSRPARRGCSRRSPQERFDRRLALTSIRQYCWASGRSAGSDRPPGRGGLRLRTRQSTRSGGSP